VAILGIFQQIFLYLGGIWQEKKPENPRGVNISLFGLLTVYFFYLTSLLDTQEIMDDVIKLISNAKIN